MVVGWYGCRKPGKKLTLIRENMPTPNRKVPPTPLGFKPRDFLAVRLKAGK